MLLFYVSLSSDVINVFERGGGGLRAIVLPKYSNRQSFSLYEGWNFNSGNYLFTTDTK